MVKAIVSENDKRGNPLHHTLWDADDVKKYIKWQMKLYKQGFVEQEEIGGFKWNLPQSTSGKKAPFPAAMQKFLKTGQVEKPGTQKMCNLIHLVISTQFTCFIQPFNGELL